jgi:hypothetical protein
VPSRTIFREIFVTTMLGVVLFLRQAFPLRQVGQVPDLPAFVGPAIQPESRTTNPRRLIFREIFVTTMRGAVLRQVGQVPDLPAFVGPAIQPESRTTNPRRLIFREIFVTTMRGAVLRQVGQVPDLPAFVGPAIFSRRPTLDSRTINPCA